MMRAVSFILLGVVLGSSVYCTEARKKVVCYYVTKNIVGQGRDKFLISDLDQALTHCTHLVYGYAGISDLSYELVPLNEVLDVDQGNYRRITEIKNRFPAVRVLLSVGGGIDDDNEEKYLTLLESDQNRRTFVNSAHSLIRSYGFDGLDLAWEFPTYKPKNFRDTVVWRSFQSAIGIKDNKEEEHRHQFTSLVKELHEKFRHDGLSVSLSVLPNVKVPAYFDIVSIMPHLEQVHILAYDFYTPARNPTEADYMSPLFKLPDRDPNINVDAVVQTWLADAPSNKLILGIPTFGRTWRLPQDFDGLVIPPVHGVQGPGAGGKYTRQPGLLSYGEICTQIVGRDGRYERLKTVDEHSSQGHGPYAYRNPNGDRDGIWISYEDAKSIGQKGDYIRNQLLGGIAIIDVSLDDYNGLCDGFKYPLLHAAKLSVTVDDNIF